VTKAPTTPADPSEGIFEALRQFRDSGVTLLLVEQNPDAALALATRCYVLDVGRVVYEGDVRALGSENRLAEFYLGLRPA